MTSEVLGSEVSPGLRHQSNESRVFVANESIEGCMNTKGIVMLVAGVTLFLFVLGIGAWVMTAPLEAGEIETKRCNEYVGELDMLKKYNWFWTPYHRRMAFNDCITRKLGDSKQP